ncbi:MAG TPA: hypothetical protein VMT34_01055, partial [Aggregatilineales bacterium]|nr:hypothetical protein [Aggregatilineales bacterium]
VLIAAVLLVTYVLVPSADVILTPAQDQLNATVQLVADSTFSGLDVEGARIPAAVDVIEVQDDATIPTTGSVDVPNTLASGIITFTNQTNQQVFVPVKTVVATAGVKPVRFETTNEVTIGAGVGKTANVAIQAAQDSAGPIGNIPSNLIVTIEGPLSKALAARNIDATQGGTLRHQGVVTQNDLDNLLSAAREKLRQKALGAFVLTPNQFVVPATIKIAEERPEWTIYSAFKGDQADSLTLTLRVRAQALIVDIQQARQVTFARLVRGLNSGRLVSPDSVTYTDPIDLHVDGNGLVSFTLSATANVAVSISPDAVRGLIAGANVDDALYKLQQTLILDSYHPPQIAIYPGILRRLPVLGARINVIVRGAA